MIEYTTFKRMERRIQQRDEGEKIMTKEEQREELVKALSKANKAWFEAFHELRQFDKDN